MLSVQTISWRKYRRRQSLNTETRGEKMKIKIEQHTFMGTVWIGAWLFTIGFLHLEFWKGVL